MDALDTLMNEHRQIEKVIDALLRYVDAVERGEADQKDLAGFVTFLTAFADRCHHGKEEDILFRAMADHGMSAEQGPIGVMLQEHGIGRDYVNALTRIDVEKEWSTADKEQLSRAARGYGFLLREHIMKEDQILYPMARQVLPPAAIEDLATRFEAFEANEMGKGEHERFHALAEELIAKY